MNRRTFLAAAPLATGIAGGEPTSAGLEAHRAPLDIPGTRKNWKRSVLLRSVVLLGIQILLCVPAYAQAPVPQTAVTLIAHGLDNPRGMAFGPDGMLYVTEAGHGSSGDGPCVVNGEHGDRYCLGATGGITRIDIKRQQQHRVVTGLGSIAPATYPHAPVGATGPSDVAFDHGHMYITTGWSLRPLSLRNQLGAEASTMGKIYQVFPNGTLTEQGDLLPYEAEHNPDGRFMDANPSSLVVRHHHLFVVDAGGNDLLTVQDHQVTGAVVFPTRTVEGAQGPRTMEAVPAAIAQGPDQAFYIGEFTGDPFPTYAARIWRWVPGHVPTIFATGFTLISDLAFDRCGNLYVLEYAQTSIKQGPSSGAVIRLSSQGKRHTLLDTGLTGPAGMTVGPDGDLYIANKSMTSQGEILRLHTHCSWRKPCDE